MISTSTALTVAKYLFGTSVAVTSLAAGGLWFFQRHLIYPAYVPEGSRKNVPRPIEIGMPYEDITLTTRDQVKIKAYLIPARRNPIPTDQLRHLTQKQREELGEREMEKWLEEIGDEKAIEYAKSRPTVVFFHANAGNMGHRVPLARKFNVDHECNVFMLSYRGYGLSEGRPSEHGIRIDIQTAMEYIRSHPILGETKIVLYGQSLGGASCLYAGSRFRDLVSGIILENTFLSLTSLIPLVLPQLPRFLLPILLTEHWDAHHTMPLIPSTTPILMIAGKNDELVKPPQMVALRHLREANGGQVKWKELDGGHNDTCLQPAYWGIIGDWLNEEIINNPLEALKRQKQAEEEEKSESSASAGSDDYQKVTREEALEAKKEL
ncbi:uncharacterized protein I303_103451 [Kwoniella dejecticola CBS 10117]|uniref:BEM46 family protein n=1 Tax=Kwoniella dejecticola CBS 10117 TaxID=1296121 RepID=A0A1A6A6S1_9TREE|nr:BEM46 family protein [Kwoniella dejecticola CBS 10117]OBR85762.1 BEM46 family protein [Kwoniella dejecticola CBS 10117]